MIFKKSSQVSIGRVILHINKVCRYYNIQMMRVPQIVSLAHLANHAPQSTQTGRTRPDKNACDIVAESCLYKNLLLHVNRFIVVGFCQTHSSKSFNTELILSVIWWIVFAELSKTNKLEKKKKTIN